MINDGELEPSVIVLMDIQSLLMVKQRWFDGYVCHKGNHLEVFQVKYLRWESEAVLKFNMLLCII